MKKGFLLVLIALVGYMVVGCSGQPDSAKVNDEMRDLDKVNKERQKSLPPGNYASP